MKAFIALGSNLNHPKAQIQDACNEIAQLTNVQFIAGSHIYQSSPVGPQDQDDFYNGCILIETSLSPIELLDALQAIEQSHHRTRERHWGPRTLDLDIILYDDQIITLPRLNIPHIHSKERLFVLLPLLDIQTITNTPIKLFNSPFEHWISQIHDQPIVKTDDTL